ncbi:MAG TPA: PEP-CTERM sorting domain-containing protein [Candidatus Bathyarchaeia archaeon]|nr:PEP-CTERM sorting domain-containing protein [Candidatus Bathyarchaeia archaeon]
MKRLLIACVALLLCSSVGFADTLTTVHSYSGTVGVAVVGFAEPGSTSASGLFSVSGIPAGASILYAGYYADNYFNLPSPTANFNGNSLGGPTATYTSDPNYNSWAWDVTPFVTGNGSYSVSSGAFSQNYGNELVVVYSWGGLPNGTVLINEGAQDNGGGTMSTSTMFALAGGGSGTLFIATGADDPFNTGEQIIFNGTVVGGPIDANLGNYASLFSLPVTTQAGANTVMLTTTGDWYGWDLAVLYSTGSTPVPEPGTMALLAGGVSLLAARLRRRA